MGQTVGLESAGPLQTHSTPSSIDVRPKVKQKTETAILMPTQLPNEDSSSMQQQIEYLIEQNNLIQNEYQEAQRRTEIKVTTVIMINTL